MNIIYLRNLITSFLQEDLCIGGDFTSYGLDAEVKGFIVSNEDTVLCGSFVFEEVFKILGAHARFEWDFKDGDEVKAGDRICSFKMRADAAISCERTALNLLQRLSGIAKNTRDYVNLVSDSKVRLLDTRKTTPGMRYLEKYAVRTGGAYNHRFGLFDAVIVKDNHIKVFGSIADALKHVKAVIPVTMSVEVEVESWDQLDEVMTVLEMVDIVMLDNWEFDDARQAVSILRRRAGNSIKIEISGNMDKLRIVKFKDLDIDFISTSRLITHAKWSDISMEIE